MNLGKNIDLIEKLKSNECLLDGYLLAITFNNLTEGSEIRCNIRPRNKTFEGIIELIFTDIIRVDLYMEEDALITDIERYKLFFSNNEVYFSLDPYDESNQIHKDDAFLISSKNIHGSVIIKCLL